MPESQISDTLYYYRTIISWKSLELLYVKSKQLNLGTVLVEIRALWKTTIDLFYPWLGNHRPPAIDFVSHNLAFFPRLMLTITTQCLEKATDASLRTVCDNDIIRSLFLFRGKHNTAFFLKADIYNLKLQLFSLIFVLVIARIEMLLFWIYTSHVSGAWTQNAPT